MTVNNYIPLGTTAIILASMIVVWSFGFLIGYRLGKDKGV